MSELAKKIAAAGGFPSSSWASTGMPLVVRCRQKVPSGQALGGDCGSPSQSAVPTVGVAPLGARTAVRPGLRDRHRRVRRPSPRLGLLGHGLERSVGRLEPRPDVHDVVHRPLDRRRPPRPRWPASGPAPPRRTRSGRGRSRRRSVGPAPRPTALTPGAPLVRPVAREAAGPRSSPGKLPARWTVTSSSPSRFAAGQRVCPTTITPSPSTTIGWRKP